MTPIGWTSAPGVWNMQPKQGLLLRTKFSFCGFLELGSLATDFLYHQSFSGILKTLHFLFPFICSSLNKQLFFPTVTQISGFLRNKWDSVPAQVILLTRKQRRLRNKTNFEKDCGVILTIVEVGGNFRKPVEGVCTATPVQYFQQRWHSIWVLEEYGIHQTEIRQV